MNRLKCQGPGQARGPAGRQAQGCQFWALTSRRAWGSGRSRAGPRPAVPRPALPAGLLCSLGAPVSAGLVPVSETDRVLAHSTCPHPRTGPLRPRLPLGAKRARPRAAAAVQARPSGPSAGWRSGEGGCGPGRLRRLQRRRNSRIPGIASTQNCKV